jgi:hypothetical protein
MAGATAHAKGGSAHSLVGIAWSRLRGGVRRRQSLRPPGASGIARVRAGLGSIARAVALMIPPAPGAGGR